MVDGKSPGLSAEPLPTMGMPGWKLGAPKFEDVEVPQENLLGREGDGFKIAMMTFDRSRPTVAAQAVGVGQGAIDLAMDYAARRETMGEPLLAHQGLQFKLAGMEADVAAARALTFQAATFVAEGDPRMTKLSAMAKLVASDTAMRVTTEAVQVLGGNGSHRAGGGQRLAVGRHRCASGPAARDGCPARSRLACATTPLWHAAARRSLSSLPSAARGRAGSASRSPSPPAASTS